MTDLGDGSPLYFSIIASLRDSFLGFGIAPIGFCVGDFLGSEVEEGDTGDASGPFVLVSE